MHLALAEKKIEMEMSPELEEKSPYFSFQQLNPTVTSCRPAIPVLTATKHNEIRIYRPLIKHLLSVSGWNYRQTSSLVGRLVCEAMVQTSIGPNQEENLRPSKSDAALPANEALCIS